MAPQVTLYNRFAIISKARICSRKWKQLFRVFWLPLLQQIRICTKYLRNFIPLVSTLHINPIILFLNFNLFLPEGRQEQLLEGQLRMKHVQDEYINQASVRDQTQTRKRVSFYLYYLFSFHLFLKPICFSLIRRLRKRTNTPLSVFIHFNFLSLLFRCTLKHNCTRK